MIGISCSANLFYCFCLHLPKGDYNQGHGQAPHPHLLKSRLGGSPSRPSLGFLFPISPTSSQLNLTAAATHPISLPTTHGKLLFVPQSPLLQVALPSSSPPKRRETVGEPVKVNQLEVDAARKCQCAKRGTPWHACAGGVHVRRPQGRPLFRPGPAAAVKPALRIQPPSLHTRGQQGGALRLRAGVLGFARLKSRLQKATSSYWLF